MSSRSACAILLIVLCAPLYGQDWEGFAAASDRSADPVLLQTMAVSPFEVNVALCRGIARRSDPDAHSIIGYLVAGYAARSTVSSELLLRFLLQGVLDANRSDAARRRWAAANTDSLDGLFSNMSQWKSAQLKGALLEFAVIAPGPTGLHAVADVGAAVVGELEASTGLIPSEDSALALDFLKAARRSARPEFFSYCTDIARLSRDKVIVMAARSAAAALATGS
jgi:hypothetical protein